MPQGMLPFKYEIERTVSGMTALAGLPLYLDLSAVMGLAESIRQHVRVREQGKGWTDVPMIISLILLNLVGGDCVDDLRILEGDQGFIRILERVMTMGMPRKERRALIRSWRKKRRRRVPSPTATFRYLSHFHDPEEEKKREAHTAFIPAPNEHLHGLMKVNGDILSFTQRHAPEKEATVDMDATLVDTMKADALYCYKGYRAYQPLNVYWAERDLLIHSEFRDGNVPAGYQQLRVLQDALEFLPEGVEKISLRSDSAGYQKDLLSYCAKGEHPRFGVIEFTVSSDVSAGFKKAALEVADNEWHQIYSERDGVRVKTDQQWAEVCYVPDWVSYSKKNPDYIKGVINFFR